MDLEKHLATFYGADAMGGVVNIITKKVSNEWTGNINVDQTLQESSQFGNSNNLNMYASGPVVKDLLGLALRGNYYNREASNIITSPINNLNYSIILYGKNRCKKIITQRVV